MAYRDIDYSIRVNGDISVPEHSIFIGDGTTLTPNQIQSDRIIGALEGDGSKVTGLNFSNIINKPTTLSGYGITAQYYTQGESETRYGTPIETLKKDLKTAQDGIDTLGTDLGNAKKSLQEQLDTAKAGFENLEIGGANIVEDSNNFSEDVWRIHGGNIIETRPVDRGYEEIKTSGGTSFIKAMYMVDYLKSDYGDEEVVISFDVINDGPQIDIAHNWLGGRIDNGAIPEGFSGTYTYTGVLSKAAAGQIQFRTGNSNTDLKMRIRRLQIQLGNKATRWKPSYKDIERKTQGILDSIKTIEEELKKKSDVGHTHDTVNIPDIRSNPPTPIDISGSTLSASFIYNSNSGNPPVSNGSSYAHILNMNGWRSANSGNGGHTSQLAFGDGLAIRLSTSGTEWGPWRQFWHSGNLNPSNLVSTGSGQRTGNGFSVGGRLLVGSVSNQNGDVIVYNNSGQPSIHLDGNSSGIESAANTRSYIDGNGNARFRETMHGRVLRADSTIDAPRVNTERINDTQVDDLSRNQSVADTGGWGVQNGMDGEAYGGELHVQPGVAYTKSGRRIEITTRTKVVMRPASSSDRRFDVLYIKGPSASTEEGEFGYFEGSVGGSEQSSLTNRALDDAVILASIRREANQASITQGNINNTVRTQSGIIGERPLYVDGNNQNVKVRYTVEANAFHEGGRHLNTIYSTLAGGNTFTSNQVFNGRIRIQSSGSLSGNHASGNYSVRMGNSSHYIATDGKEFLGSSDMVIGANGELTLKANRLNAEAPVKASRNATTVSIPAGQTRATWTHNYGNTNYAVNLTTNSFERHVRWDNKANNTIAIEIDDATDKEILVDCILMGY